MNSDNSLESFKDSKRLAVVLSGTDLQNGKRRKVKVLDEDTYIENVEKIISRDFFPDLEKLKAQAEYIDAVERKDTDKIWELRRKYSTSVVRRRTSPTQRLTTPSTFETPTESIKQTPTAVPAATPAASTSSTSADVEQEQKQDESPAHNPEPKDALKNVGLDAFLSHNTSEDNVSFAEIMNESEKRRRLKNAWLYEAEEKHRQNQVENLALPSIEQQAISSTSKDVQGWTYIAKNAVMYIPEGVAETSEEMLRRSVTKPREILHKNTRFTADPFNEQQNKQSLTQAASSQALMLHGKIGADGKEILPTNTPRLGGYGFVATPSPAPGVDASPLMTWGEIEGTPFMLDPTDTPLMNRTPGPIFKVPAVPKRDKLLLQLTEKASKAHRAKKQEAIKQCQASFSRTASPATPKGDRLAFLSPAAQRLAIKKFGINRVSSDKALRDSYTPSPSRKTPQGSVKTPTSLTPNSNTPKSARKTPGHKTPTHVTPKHKPSLTDDLLQLPKRPKAHELF